MPENTFGLSGNTITLEPSESDFPIHDIHSESRLFIGGTIMQDGREFICEGALDAVLIALTVVFDPDAVWSAAWSASTLLFVKAASVMHITIESELDSLRRDSDTSRERESVSLLRPKRQLHAVRYIRVGHRYFNCFRDGGGRRHRGGFVFDRPDIRFPPMTLRARRRFPLEQCQLGIFSDAARPRYIRIEFVVEIGWHLYVHRFSSFKPIFSALKPSTRVQTAVLPQASRELMSLREIMASHAALRGR
jgi:hypothetical protein